MFKGPKGIEDYDIIVAKDDDDLAENWIPTDRAFYVDEVHKMEGVRFRHAYVTSAAIEHGHAGIFATLYRVTKFIPGARVLHVSDYRGY